MCLKQYAIIQLLRAEKVNVSDLHCCLKAVYDDETILYRFYRGSIEEVCNKVLCIRRW